MSEMVTSTEESGLPPEGILYLSNTTGRGGSTLAEASVLDRRPSTNFRDSDNGTEPCPRFNPPADRGKGFQGRKASNGMDIEEVSLSVPDGFQLIVGQGHFIKTVEDIYEAVVTAVPGIRFGVAFCEASGKALVRSDGTDPESSELAVKFAGKLGVGHSFVLLLKGSFPINVLNRIKAVDEVVRIFCATSNEVTFIVAKAGKGRAVLGVADGIPPKGVESEADREERRKFLRDIGYKR